MAAAGYLQDKDMGFLLELASLFFFALASAGFILSMVKYPRGSAARLWGIRLCHLFGFAGVGLLRWARGQFSDLALLVVSSLVVSMIAFELSSRFLKPGRGREPS